MNLVFSSRQLKDLVFTLDAWPCVRRRRNDAMEVFNLLGKQSPGRGDAGALPRSDQTSKRHHRSDRRSHAIEFVGRGRGAADHAAEPAPCNLQPDVAKKIIARLGDARIGIIDTLIDLAACKLAAERISDAHFGAKEFLFQSLQGDTEALGEEACNLAELYMGLIHDMIQNQASFNDNLGDCSEFDIDFKALRQLAQEKAELQFANLIEYADVIMHAAFGNVTHVLAKWPSDMGTAAAPNSDNQVSPLDALLGEHAGQAPSDE
jgi:hypothetical protein